MSGKVSCRGELNNSVFVTDGASVGEQTGLRRNNGPRQRKTKPKWKKKKKKKKKKESQ